MYSPCDLSLSLKTWHWQWRFFSHPIPTFHSTRKVLHQPTLGCPNNDYDTGLRVRLQCMWLLFLLKQRVSDMTPHSFSRRMQCISCFWLYYLPTYDFSNTPFPERVGKYSKHNRYSLWKVNALKISASDTDMGEISAIGTDLVGTSFQCHSHGTDFQ